MNDQKFSKRIARIVLLQLSKAGNNLPKYHKIYLMVIQYTKWLKNNPNGHKIYIFSFMALQKYPNWELWHANKNTIWQPCSQIDLIILTSGPFSQLLQFVLQVPYL
jgi:hypothetical protein